VAPLVGAGGRLAVQKLAVRVAVQEPAVLGHAGWWYGSEGESPHVDALAGEAVGGVGMGGCASEVVLEMCGRSYAYGPA